MLRVLALLVSIAIHVGLVLFLLIPSGGAALEQGSGQDIMVVEQGMALEGMAKLGQDVATLEPVEAPPVETATAAPPPADVKPIEEGEIIQSEQGPEQEKVFDDKPEQIKQPPPPQIQTIQQEAVVAEQESSGQLLQGGDTTAQSAYLGALRTRLEKNKINPRTDFAGTAVVHFVVDANGQLVSREVSVSSGQKALDDAAVASIDKAAPFPPMPKGLHRDRMDVSVPFKFSVR